MAKSQDKELWGYPDMPYRVYKHLLPRVHAFWAGICAISDENKQNLPIHKYYFGEIPFPDPFWPLEQCKTYSIA